MLRHLSLAARDFGLREGYSHGVRTLGGDKRSHFLFRRKLYRQPSSYGAHPGYIVPHLDQAFERIVGVGKEKTRRLCAELSSREKEILNWVKDGKSTWEISMILSISTNTVQFHMKNIMEKLQVVSRSQAVAVALQNGLLHIE